MQNFVLEGNFENNFNVHFTLQPTYLSLVGLCDRLTHQCYYDDLTGQLAVCGELFDAAIKLPYVEFLPETVPYEFFITGEFLEARLYVPETNTSHALLLALADNARVTNRDGHKLNEPFGTNSRWRKHTKRE